VGAALVPAIAFDRDVVKQRRHDGLFRGEPSAPFALGTAGAHERTAHGGNDGTRGMMRIGRRQRISVRVAHLTERRFPGGACSCGRGAGGWIPQLRGSWHRAGEVRVGRYALASDWDVDIAQTIVEQPGLFACYQAAAAGVATSSERGAAVAASGRRGTSRARGSSDPAASSEPVAEALVGFGTRSTCRRVLLEAGWLGDLAPASPERAVHCSLALGPRRMQAPFRPLCLADVARTYWLGQPFHSERGSTPKSWSRSSLGARLGGALLWRLTSRTALSIAGASAGPGLQRSIA
jgi:hypothetical protein